jgi:cephalosporin hydroxylase
MYDRAVVTGANARLTVETDLDSRTVDLYTDEGMKLVAGLWVKLAAQFRLMYEPSWLGIPIIQVPCDIVLMQELIWRLRPDWIVECGVAHGGSAVLYASLCELAGKGRVLGVDAEIRKYNRVAIEAHPLTHRIELLEGSSTSAETVDEVRRKVAASRTVLVVLDSNHSASHVLEEMRLYGQFVTPGSYLVVMDGAQADVWDIPRGQQEWRESHPLKAIGQFLSTHPEFEDDPHYTRLHITSCPQGFLRRRQEISTP